MVSDLWSVGTVPAFLIPWDVILNEVKDLFCYISIGVMHMVTVLISAAALVFLLEVIIPVAVIGSAIFKDKYLKRRDHK